MAKFDEEMRRTSLHEGRSDEEMRRTQLLQGRILRRDDGDERRRRSKAVRVGDFCGKERVTVKRTSSGGEKRTSGDATTAPLFIEISPPIQQRTTSGEMSLATSPATTPKEMLLQHNFAPPITSAPNLAVFTISRSEYKLCVLKKLAIEIHHRGTRNRRRDPTPCEEVISTFNYFHLFRWSHCHTPAIPPTTQQAEWLATVENLNRRISDLLKPSTL
ncbi:hypothetical protein L484_013710 [Morus notabilis]|uniref:Uncharacterized protein n=1 Tax=Morus notabilis TaxID=981085 RepID=W9S4J4_9ROSA|nr:hypothetical protein L484_013710 [Morus notabilis]